MATEYQIFISYAREDTARVKELYERLRSAGYQPWLDREHIIPGQRWEPVIKEALKRSAFVLVCLSETSINKRGFLQKEIKQALEHADEKLEDDVWLIPARLDDCEVPESLGAIQWVDLFLDHGFDDLLRGLEFQLKKLQRTPPQGGRTPAPRPVKPPPSVSTPPPPPVSPGKRVRFTTVRLDESGKIVERKEQERPLIVEDLGGVRIELVEIPGGEFWMGSTSADAKIAHTEALRWYKDAEEKWYQAETPRHRVRVSSFAMGRYPVTQEEWLEVMGDLPEMEQKQRGDRRPVVNVSWEEAGQFCRELSRRSGKEYRLPTEAEWEYAARAGTTTAYWCGPVLAPEVANYWWSHPFGAVKPGKQLGRTWEVGSSGFANPFGLTDIHGNVWEWCSDRYGEKYYAECHAKGTVDHPTGPGGGSDRVIRGGGWYFYAVNCRSASRYGNDPGNRYGNLGFRLVRIGR